MKLRFYKEADKPTTISFVRSDGSVTHSQLDPAMIHHDLFHYAVETELALPQGFYGHLACGFDIAAFGVPDPVNGLKPRLPSDLLVAELLTALFQYEHAGATQPEEFREALAMACMQFAVPVPPITDEQISAIRAAFEAALLRWHATEPGQFLELEWSLPAF